MGTEPTRRESHFDSLAAAVLFGPERILSGNCGDYFQYLPLRLGFKWFLELEKLERMNLSSVGSNVAFSKQRIISRHGLHRRHDGHSIRAASNLVHGLQVMNDRGIDEAACDETNGASRSRCRSSRQEHDWVRVNSQLGVFGSTKLACLICRLRCSPGRYHPREMSVPLVSRANTRLSTVHPAEMHTG